MSYLLETLGKGLLGRLLTAFEEQFGCAPDDDPRVLDQRRRDASTSFDLAIRLGAAQLRDMRLSAARRAFEEALGLDGPEHLPLIGLACVYDECGRPDRVLDLLRQADHMYPHNAPVAFCIGQVCEQLEQEQEAVAAYRRAAELCPDLRNAHERLAAIAVYRGRWDAARDSYIALADAEPADLDTLSTLAGLHLMAGDLPDAIDTFQRALLIEPETDGETLEIAAEFENDGELHRAIDTVEKLVAKYPGVTEFHVHLGDLYVKVGNDEAAVAEYRTALELHPSFLEATVKLGTQHLRRRRYDAAARLFTRATDLNDRLLGAFVGLGVAQHLAGYEADAQATFDLALSLAPNSTLLLAESNRLHMMAVSQAWQMAPSEAPAGPGGDGALLEAIRRHQQLLVRHPLRADLHYRHGMLLRQIGEFACAEQALREATTIAPAFAPARLKLGIAMFELGQPAEGLSAFQHAVVPDEAEIRRHYELALLYSQYSRFEWTLESFEATLTGCVGAEDFRHNLALALQNVGLVDRVEATWHGICELTSAGPPPGIRDRMPTM